MKSKPHKKVNPKLSAIVKLLNKELKIRTIHDQSRNGLQVRASTSIRKVALATDASIDTFEKAKSAGCDLIIVHHGIFWKGQKDIENMNKRRVAFLKKNKISLYVAHLPLDKSRKYGHNTYLLKILGIEPEKTFGGVGYIGSFKNPKSVSSIVTEINNKLNTKSHVWKFGKNKIKKVAVLSGAGSSCIPEAIKKKVDLFITGEVFSWMYYPSKEAKLNVIIAGHYKTETSGVKSLGDLLSKKFDIETTFLDSPTDI